MMKKEGKKKRKKQKSLFLHNGPLAHNTWPAKALPAPVTLLDGVSYSGRPTLNLLRGTD